MPTERVLHPGDPPSPVPVAAPGAPGSVRTGAVRTGAPGLLRSCHPVPSLAVAALVTALARAWGRDTAGCLLVAAAVLSGQLSAGWCNDRVDLRRDTAARRADKPLVTGEVRAGAVTAAAGVALVACVPLSLLNGPAAGAAHLIGVLAAWCYNLGVKRTVLSWVPYAVGFGLLPAFVALGLPGHPWPPVRVTAAGVLLGIGAHAANVLPDIEPDLAAGVRGLPQRMGRSRARLLAAVALVGAAALLVLGPPGHLGVPEWGALATGGTLSVLAVALPTGPAGRGRAPFLATLGVAAVDLGLLVLRGSPPG